MRSACSPLSHTWARASGSRIEISQDLTHVWTLRDRKVIRLDTYSTKAEALEAVGLSEQDAHAKVLELQVGVGDFGGGDR